MKRIIAAVTACMVMVVSFAYFAAETDNGSALGTVVHIRHNIDSHTSQIQKKNAKLLRLSAEELASANFAEYDTTATLLGDKLYDFTEASGSARSGAIENALGGEDKITTLSGDKYSVHSVQAYGKYPDLFPSNSILRTAKSKRARLVCDYGEDVPDYQIVKDKKNIYAENIDFYDFPVIKFENCSNIIFNNCTFTGFLDNGLVFRNCNDISIVNCTFTDCGTRTVDATNGGYGIRIVGDEDIKSQNILIENTKIEHSYGKAISLVGSVDNYVVRNNTINNTVWGAIDYWYPAVSGDFVNVVENNTCTNIGFGAPSSDDRAAKTSGVGCAAIFAGMGSPMPKSIVKNNTIKNVVETGIEGPYEIVYHNNIKNTGEKSATRYTGSTEAVFIKPAADYEQKYVDNDIETRGLRCFSSYSDSAEEYKAIYIVGNKMSLRKSDSTITCNYKRSDVEINCKKLKKLVISGNEGMLRNEPSVNIYLEKGYTMDYFDLDNPCMIGAMPESAQYCFNISNGQFE